MDLPRSLRANLAAKVTRLLLVGGGMAGKLFSLRVVVSLIVLVAAANAQRNELTGIIGRTFVSDHASIDTSTPGALLTSNAGLSLEGNYGRHLLDLGLVGLTAEVPFVVNLG